MSLCILKGHQEKQFVKAACSLGFISVLHKGDLFPVRFHSSGGVTVLVPAETLSGADTSEQRRCSSAFCSKSRARGLGRAHAVWGLGQNHRASIIWPLSIPEITQLPNDESTLKNNQAPSYTLTYFNCLHCYWADLLHNGYTISFFSAAAYGRVTV